MVYQFEVTRYNDMDPLRVIEQATRQAQAEAVVATVRQTTPADTAPTFFYEHEDGFTDMKVWSKDPEVLETVLAHMEERFGILKEEYEIEALPERSNA